MWSKQMTLDPDQTTLRCFLEQTNDLGPWSNYTALCPWANKWPWTLTKLHCVVSLSKQMTLDPDQTTLRCVLERTNDLGPWPNYTALCPWANKWPWTLTKLHCVVSLSKQMTLDPDQTTLRCVLEQTNDLGPWPNYTALCPWANKWPWTLTKLHCVVSLSEQMTLDPDQTTLRCVLEQTNDLGPWPNYTALCPWANKWPWTLIKLHCVVSLSKQMTLDPDQTALRCVLEQTNDLGPWPNYTALCPWANKWPLTLIKLHCGVSLSKQMTLDPDQTTLHCVLKQTNDLGPWKNYAALCPWARQDTKVNLCKTVT